ncbi:MULTISPECIES: DUF72 domain-containing protein [unclassified Curtobacterium]|uniref:DUF72 domain-containing protein n=1 Tax=unclassified Curtobacterium TaxID=257496 RepID=UPI000D95F35E|nr:MULTISPECIES: DUF72 domain-containing protein [unclassified Curtobacterium]PYY37105.1 DUF72 domain-containing protein [Curtobacterium sp. MCPF17_046]WIB14446.1 DUF72 domain-containing protein [Curtobacterium sp. MCPF17_050]
MTVRIGLSGWQYDSWRGDFYPEGLAKRRWLEHVGDRFPAVEVNGSFYSLQRPSRYRAWRAAVPEGFRFALKGGRYLTHMLRLRNVDTALANFFASGPLELGPALGPVLWQLPEHVVPTPEVLDAFLAALPRSHGDAATLATGHDAKVAEPATTTEHARLRIDHALEVRSPDAGTPEHLAVLRRHRVALVDSHAGDFPRFVHDTDAPLAYLRLHGAPHTYHDGYPPEALADWASTVRRHDEAGRDVWVFFDNDAERHAPWDALGLARLVGRPQTRSDSPGASETTSPAGSTT